MPEHTQITAKEQLNTAQRRLNAALNVLEETVKEKAGELKSWKVQAESATRQMDELQGYAFELESRNTALSAQMRSMDSYREQMKAVSHQASKELEEALDALQTILQKQTLLEKLEA